MSRLSIKRTLYLQKDDSKRYIFLYLIKTDYYKGLSDPKKTACEYFIFFSGAVKNGNL